jgi:hypothetical protein
VRTSFNITVRRAPGARSAGGGAVSGAVRGRLFFDARGDGRRNNGDTAPVGVEVFLDADGVADAEEPAAITLPGGAYEFPTVPPGEYHLRANLPPGWRVSGVAAGPLARPVAVRGGKAARVKPIGLTQKVLIAGRVYHDANRDSVPDAGEAGLRGWRVFLDHNGDGARQSSEPTARTDRSGRWAFGRLDRGAYRVTLLPRPGYSVTSPAGGAIEVVVAGEGMTDGDNFIGVAPER